MIRFERSFQHAKRIYCCVLFRKRFSLWTDGAWTGDWLLDADDRVLDGTLDLDVDVETRVDEAFRFLVRARARRIVAPDFAQVRRGLRPGIYEATYLNPPSGSDCECLLVRTDGSLGWCDEDGTEDGSRFSARELCEEA